MHEQLFILYRIASPFDLKGNPVKCKSSYNQKHITPKRLNSLICLEPCSGFLADSAVQSEVRKIILPKYGIREFKAKTFELATLIHVCLQPKEIVSWHKR